MNLKNRVLVGVVSATLLTGTAMLEGTRYTPYQDIAGVLTVCQGHTGKDIVKSKVYTKEECKALLERDLKVHREGVAKCVNVPLTPYQFDAFTLFAYNVGVNNFCQSHTVAEPLNKGDYRAACNGLLKWVNVNGKPIKGLQTRREYERRMCLGELETT